MGLVLFPNKPGDRSPCCRSPHSWIFLSWIPIPSCHILGVTAPFPSFTGAGWGSRADFGVLWERCPVGCHPRTQCGAREVTAIVSCSGILSPLPRQSEGSNLGFPVFPFALSFLFYFGVQQPGENPRLFWQSRYYPFLFIPEGSSIPCSTVIYFFSCPLIFFFPKPSLKSPNSWSRTQGVAATH